MQQNISTLTKIKSIAIVLIVFCVQVFAQPAWKVDIDGGVKDEDTKQPLEGSKIEIYKGSSIIKTIYTNEKGKFRYYLDPNEEYTFKVSFNKYISKLISVSTKNVPEKVDISGNFIVKMQVSLFREVPDIDFSLLDKPIGSIFYEPKENNFGYDVDEVMGQKMEQLQKEYEKKMKDRLAQVKKEQEDAEKKLLADKQAAEKAEKEAAKNAAKASAEAEKEAKKRELQEKAEKEAQMKAEAKAKAELAVQEEAKKKAENEQERAARKKAEKEAFEQAEIKRKQEAAEKKEREQKLREEAAERIKQNGLSKEKIVKDVIQKKETNIIPVENIRTSQSEGVNYVIYHTFITLLGEEIEYKKIIFTWGGTYHKRAGLDIPNLTYVQELKMYGAEIPK